ncbi:hypothetical protein CBER1_09357 [Cercospora berteroae]|uniref:Uncharacterized protein n=1 Tax=Cercospora berteroae TaxID=357750 RepID=A0A2S6BVD2_9PEZI|nr:hypothetical protein CBER1_09357 [Cercospora berteroae]
MEGEDDEAEEDEQEYEENSNYSREDTIEAFRDYYKCLTTMYMDPARIEEPPEDGWPEITPATIQALGKTEEVYTLLHELPYIKQDTDHKVHGSPECVWANWNSLANAINKGYPAEDVRFTTETKFIHESNPEEVPPHVIGLADNTSEDPKFLLDTVEGNIYWLHGPDTICRDDDLVCENGYNRRRKLSRDRKGSANVIKGLADTGFL